VLADALTRLGHGSECATWRNCFLMGAKELSHGIKPTALSASAGMARAMTVTQLFDSIAIRIDGPRAANTTLSILWQFTDREERYLMQLSHGVLNHHPTARTPQTDLTVTLSHPQLLEFIATGAVDGWDIAGDPVVLSTIMSLTDVPDPSFAVVTP
jgi:alkyl sulfatase BDS1-like metallo-beta-lactamase superfamily hydrolase